MKGEDIKFKVITQYDLLDEPMPILVISGKDIDTMHMDLRTLNITKAMTDLKFEYRIPEGYEYDKDNSKPEEGIIKFKEIKKTISYADNVLLEILDENYYYINAYGQVCQTNITWESNGNEAPTEKQLKALLALNKLKNVATYLNGDWKPDWKNRNEYKHSLAMAGEDISTDFYTRMKTGIPVFYSKEAAQQAIEILGESTVKLALSFGSL